jgi:rubredoxin
VVEWETDLSVLVSYSIGTWSLKLFDKIFVCGSCETFTFFTVKEYVVNEEDGINDRSRCGGTIFSEYERACGVEVEVDADIVVLYVYTLPFGIFSVMSYAGTRLYLKPSLGD